MRLATLVLVALALAGCKNDYHQTAFMKLSNAPIPSGAWIATHAPYNYVAVSYGVWDNIPMRTAYKQLKQVNPSIKLGTYYSVHSIGQWMVKAPLDTRARGYWEAMKPYLAHTTTGDTASIYQNAYLWNVLDPRARLAAIEQLVFYVRDNRLDWAMLDFISVPLPNLKSPYWESFEDGDLDLDGNGVSHWEDTDEQVALRAAFGDYIAQARSLLPPGFRLIPNGSLALMDTTFSRLVDGCYVEGFPAWFYGSDTGSYVNAFNDAYGPQSLPQLTRYGRWAVKDPAIMIEDRYDRGLIAYVAMMYDGAVEMKRPMEPAVDTTTPVDLSYLGVPRGPATFVDGLLVREFTTGTLTLRVTPTTLQPLVERK